MGSASLQLKVAGRAVRSAVRSYEGVERNLGRREDVALLRFKIFEE